MREIRLFTPQALATQTTIELDRDASKHASQVLRLKAGAHVTLFNGDAQNYFGKISESGKNTRVEIVSKAHNTNESPFKIKLVQGISRSAKMDFTLQKSIELGVAEIQVVICNRSIVNSDEARLEKRLRHWNSVIVSACEQSGRSVVPTLASIRDLQSYLSRAPDVSAKKIMLDPGAELSFREVFPVENRCEILIGPEGGFEANEISSAKLAGFTPLAFGPRVLRTETAGLAAIAVLQSCFGDLS